MTDYHNRETDQTQTALSGEAVAVPVNINCPACGVQHIDEGEWATRPHKTHQCQACGHEWRPFPYPTVGITSPITNEPVGVMVNRDDLERVLRKIELIRENPCNTIGHRIIFSVREAAARLSAAIGERG